MESIMESIRKNPSIYLIEGILLIILGTIAIVLPITSTIALTLILGWVLIIGGIYRFFRSIKLKSSLNHFWLSLSSGIVATIVGILLLGNIVKGIYLLTILLAIYFLVDGISSIFHAMTSRENHNWSWLLLSGIVTLILSVLILSGLPYTAVWILGLLLGINLILTGFAITYAAANATTPIRKYSNI